LLLLSALLATCRHPPTFTKTFESDEAAARAVLDAVAHNDAEALADLALTEEDFEDVMWPTLPVSRPAVGMPMDYVWQDTLRKSRAYLAQTLADYGGKRFELVRIEFLGETTAHEGYSVSRKSQLVVKETDGRERTIRLFGSIIRQGGRSKINSYILD
jgi:hypothetical protein